MTEGLNTSHMVLGELSIYLSIYLYCSRELWWNKNVPFFLNVHWTFSEAQAGGIWAEAVVKHGWKMSEEMEGDGWRFSSTELMKPEDDIGSDPQFRCLGDINIK